MGKNKSTNNSEQLLAYGVSLGAAFGAAFGAIFESIGIAFGVSFGIIAGVTIASVFGKKIFELFGNPDKTTSNEKKE